MRSRWVVGPLLTILSAVTCAAAGAESPEGRIAYLARSPEQQFDSPTEGACTFTIEASDASEPQLRTLYRGVIDIRR